MAETKKIFKGLEVTRYDGCLYGPKSGGFLALVNLPKHHCTYINITTEDPSDSNVDEYVWVNSRGAIGFGKSENDDRSTSDDSSVSYVFGGKDRSLLIEFLFQIIHEEFEKS